MTRYASVGSDVPLTWEFPAELDAPPALTITGPGVVSAIPTVALDPADDNLYYTVWRVPVGLAPGTYTATLAGLIDEDPYDEVVTVILSSTDLYLSLTEFKAEVLPGVTSTARDARILSLLAACSGAVDGECGRTFGRSLASPRIFDPTWRSLSSPGGGATLLVDDIADSEGVIVEVGGTRGDTGWVTVDPATYEFRRITEDPGWPYEAIQRFQTPWNTGYGNRVRVTAPWGWPRIPAAAIEAVRLQSTRLFARKGSPEGVAGPADWGLIRQPRLDVDVRGMLARLIKVGVA